MCAIRKMTAMLLGMAVAGSYSQTPQPDYFPIHIGDKWFYEHRTGGLHGIHWANKIIEVTDTTMIDDKTYYVFEDRLYDIHYEPGRIYYTTHYYRKAENGDIMKYSTLINQEQLYYTVQKDSLYQSYIYRGDFDLVHNWEITFFDTNATIRIPSGSFLNCYDYSFGLMINDNRIVFSAEKALAPDIGFIYEGAEGDLNFIVGAYVNGKLMGDTTLTSVQETSQSNLPSHPTLYQNSPNPFTLATHITYYLPEYWHDPVRISIFNIAGREVMAFEINKTPLRNHEIRWNGRDRFGKAVRSGCYIVSLQSGRFSQMIKINLVR